MSLSIPPGVNEPLGGHSSVNAHNNSLSGSAPDYLIKDMNYRLEQQKEFHSNPNSKELMIALDKNLSDIFNKINSFCSPDNFESNLESSISDYFSFDVLTHALEAFTSAGQNEYGDAIAYGSIKLVAQYLPALMNDLSNVDLRQKLQLASHMAGVAFNISSLGLVHGVGHPLSAVLNQAHGQTLATMLPHVMEFNMPVRADKYAEVAKAFNVYDSNLSDEANARKRSGWKKGPWPDVARSHRSRCVERNADGMQGS